MQITTLYIGLIPNFKYVQQGFFGLKDLFMEDSKYIEHESFGKIRIGKVCGGINLFDSNIQGEGAIVIEISTAKVDRHLNHDWIGAEKQLIEVYLSPLQWAEAITTAMSTAGVSCTLNRVMGKSIEEPPIRDMKAEFKQEVDDNSEQRMSDVIEANEKLKEILDGKGAIKKTELREIQSILDSGIRHFASNIKYTEKCFTESVDRTVLEAKQSIHHYINTKIQELGVESFKELHNVKMIEIDND